MMNINLYSMTTYSNLDPNLETYKCVHMYFCCVVCKNQIQNQKSLIICYGNNGALSCETYSLACFPQ